MNPCSSGDPLWMTPSIRARLYLRWGFSCLRPSTSLGALSVLIAVLILFPVWFYSLSVVVVVYDACCHLGIQASEARLRIFGFQWAANLILENGPVLEYEPG